MSHLDQGSALWGCGYDGGLSTVLPTYSAAVEVEYEFQIKIVRFTR